MFCLPCDACSRVVHPCTTRRWSHQLVWLRSRAMAYVSESKIASRFRSLKLFENAMCRTIIQLLPLLGLVVAIPVAARGDILAVSYSNPSVSNGMTFRINETTGTGVAVGLSNVNFLNSLARTQNGVFWSAGQTDGAGHDHLITIDPVTGVGTIGPLMDIPDASIRGLAFSPANVLYGMALNDDLYTIDTQTGAGTLIGHVGGSKYPGLQAIAFAPDGALYGWGVGLWGLIRIDPATGAYTDVNSAVGGGGFIQSMTFGPDGTLYGARDYLYRIDTTTGVATQIGVGGGFADVRGIAMLPIPEPSTFALLGIGVFALLACAGRRRRA
jgi:hypothetical protein